TRFKDTRRPHGVRPSKAARPRRHRRALVVLLRRRHDFDPLAPSGIPGFLLVVFEDDSRNFPVVAFEESWALCSTPDRTANSSVARGARQAFRGFALAVL